MIEILSTKGLEKKSPLSVVFFVRLDEAYCEVGEDDTAFSGGRNANIRPAVAVSSS
jgi:hypothetical protein